MKAAAIKEKKLIETVDINEAQSDGNKVIADVILCGICGSDIHNWDAGSPVGLVMGHEICARVVDPGSRSDLKVGDRISALPVSPCLKCDACLSGNIQYCPETWTHALGLSLDNPGGLTRRIAIRPDMVVKVPDNISDEEVAMVEPAAVGLHAVHLGNIEAGDKVLIIGGGIIGLMSGLFAKLQGASYVALMEVNEARGKRSVELEVADEWFDAKDENVINTLMEKSNGGFEVVIDASGNSAAVNSAVMACKPGGLVVLAGVATGPINFYSVLAVTKELTVKGSIAYTKREFEMVIDLMSHKRISVLKFLSDTVSLDEVQGAYERLTSGTDSAIKILVDPNR